MFKKTWLVLLAITLAAGMAFVGCGGNGGDGESFALPLGAISLGNFSFQTGDGDSAGAESQVAWEIEDAIAVTALETAESIVFVTKNSFNGLAQVIWQRWDGDGYDGWNSKDILTDVGGILSGVTEKSTDQGYNLLTVTLAELANYGNFVAALEQGKIKIILAYYSGSNKARSLGVETAFIP